MAQIKSFWSTALGIVTTIAGLIGALAALVTALSAVGVFTARNDNSRAPAAIPSAERAGLGQHSASTCWAADPGAGLRDRDAHARWAAQQTAAALAENLTYKLGLVFGCGALSLDQLASAFASISVVIGQYVPDAACFGGDQGASDPDWSAHKGWAARQGHAALILHNLQRKTAAAVSCLERERQEAFFADVSVAIAAAL